MTTMTALLGTSIPVYLGVVVIIMGFAAYMTGQAMANTWKPAWHVVVYTLLLGIGSRFLVFALYDGELFSATGYVIDLIVLYVIGLFAYRLTRARKMVSQYPWMYERVGLFGWRARHEAQ